MQGPDEPPRQKEEMRDDLARKTALHRPVQPARRVGLPGARPFGEAHLDRDAPWRADLAALDPAPERRHGRRRGEGKVDRASIAGLRHEPPDRKSTRLNSSHSQISYAVFCLQKT